MHGRPAGQSGPHGEVLRPRKVLAGHRNLHGRGRGPRVPHETLTLSLKYGTNRQRAIQSLKRVSKPGLRVYTANGSVLPC